MADDASVPSDDTATVRQDDPRPPAEAVEITPRDFRESFGEELTRTLDLDTWRAGQDLSQEYSRIEAEVREAVLREDALLQGIRREIFPRLGGFASAPKGAGVYEAKTGDLEKIHRGLLFNGGVEACDGTVQTHDTLPLTVYQIGVSLVSYGGDQGTWFQRLYRRDLRVTDRNPTEEVIELLERRERRGALNQSDRRDSLSELARRAIMSYAERAILLKRSEATWRMGHGNPAPYELLTGAGSQNLMIEATKIIRELVEGHRRFVFVASEPSDRVLLTIGQALRPLEYAIVDTLHGRIARIVENGHYRIDPKNISVDNTWDGKKLMPEAWIRRFRDEVAPQVVVGIFRATRLAPAQVFYAHVDHADVAAHIVLADSVLQEHRGFPLLIDLADHVCGAVFGRDSLAGLVNTAYAEAGAPWRYLSERQTRSH
jgi:hypothetical protein